MVFRDIGSTDLMFYEDDVGMGTEEAVELVMVFRAGSSLTDH